MIQAGLDYSNNWDTESFYRPVPQVKKVRRTYRKSNPKGKVFVKAAVALFAYALILVYLCIKGATLGYQIVELEKDIQQMETANQRLEYGIAEKCSLGYVEIAAQELGMEKADQGITVAVLPEVEPVIIDESHNGSSSQIGQNPLNKLYNNLLMLAQNNL
jgi:cell division protein FtsL